MIRLLKGAFERFDPSFDRWDEPVIRTRVDGTPVVGRETRGFGDGVFTYAGKEYLPERWDTQMTEIKDFAEDLVEEEISYRPDFTFCLVGRYPNGDTGIPHHSDTVPTEDDLVLSISFGASRVFEWKDYPAHIKDHTNTSDIHLGDRQFQDMARTTTYVLEHGDAILFDGMSQLKSTHAVPSVFCKDERINLTFRTGL